MDLIAQRALEHLAGRWRDVDATALSSGFALLARGTAVTAREIAAAAEISESRVVAALESERVGKDEHGRLIELFGVSIVPAAYRTRFAGGELFACCALVAIMVPWLVGRAVEISGRDPETGEPVALRVDEHRPDRVSPSSMAATLVETEARSLLENAGENFCRHVRLFASPTSAASFAGADPRRRVVPVAELFSLGRALYRAVWAA